MAKEQAASVHGVTDISVVEGEALVGGRKRSVRYEAGRLIVGGISFSMLPALLTALAAVPALAEDAKIAAPTVAKVTAGIKRCEGELGVHPSKLSTEDKDRYITLAVAQGLVPKEVDGMPTTEGFEHVLVHVPDGWFTKEKPSAPKKAAAPPAKATSNGVANGKAAPPPAAAATPPAAAGGAKYPKPVIEEIKAAYGVTPSLVPQAEKERLLALALDDGIIEVGEEKAAGCSQWELLCKKAAPGFFKQAKEASAPAAEGDDAWGVEEGARAAAKGKGTAAAPRKPTPAAPEPEEEEEAEAAAEPDAAEELEPEEEESAPEEGKLDESYLKAPDRKFHEVIQHLVAAGYGEFQNLVETCNYYKDAVPCLGRVTDMPNRVKSTVLARGLKVDGAEAT